MWLRKSLPVLLLFIAFYLLGGASPSYAGDCDSMSVTILTASGGVTVMGSNGVFSVNFGGVNGLGIGTPAAGVSRTVSGSGATYTTPVTIRVNHNGCSGSGSGSANLKVYQDSTTSSASRSAAREGSVPGSVIAVPTVQASATLINSSVSNGATFTRYVGVFVSNANGGSAVSGALAPKFIYRIVVND
jgi:hypothetical protein